MPQVQEFALLSAISRFYLPRQGEGMSQGIDSINMVVKALVRLWPTLHLMVINVYYVT